MDKNFHVKLVPKFKQYLEENLQTNTIKDTHHSQHPISCKSHIFFLYLWML